MEDTAVEMMLNWLFVKTDEDILVDAEVAALYSMLIPRDPRPEPVSNNS
jgi:hypothetical protein